MRRWKLGVLGAVVCSLVVWMISARRGADADTADPPPPTASEPEPITGTPSYPDPGDETGPINPFAPPPEGDVALEDLTLLEQEYVLDHMNADGWADIHAAFSTATQQAAADAQSQAAANLLGLEGVGDEGVVQ